MIATLVVFGGRTALPRLAVLLAWGSVAGSALQFAVQLPAVLARRARTCASRSTRRVRARAHVAQELRAGVHQPRRRADQRLHRRAAREPAADRRGHRARRTRSCCTLLPVSLFGMSISAAELPAMSARRTRRRGAEALRGGSIAGLRRIAFFVVPSAMAFLALGDVVAAALLQTGRFRREDAVYVWGILAGSAVGLLRVDAGASVLLGLLRAARHPHAAAVCARACRAATVPRLRCLRFRCRDCSACPRVWGAAGLTASAGRGRLGGDAAAAHAR